MRLCVYQEISDNLEFFDGKLDSQEGLVPRSHVEKHDAKLASTADANLTLAEKLEETRSELQATKQELAATKEELATAKTKVHLQPATPHPMQPHM